MGELVSGSGVRCGDADRERAGARLREAAGEGRLTMDELDERLTAAYAARYGHELEALFHDLPAGSPRGGFGLVGSGGRRAILATIWARLMSHVAALRNRRGATLVAVLLVIGLATLMAGEVFDDLLDD